MPTLNGIPITGLLTGTPQGNDYIPGVDTLDPTQSADGTTKKYTRWSEFNFALYALGSRVLDAAKVATTSALTANYSNGTSGIGAQLTNSGVKAALIIDGITLSFADIVVVKNQVNTYENGIYLVLSAGSASTNWVLGRVSFYDETSEILQYDTILVTKGIQNAGIAYQQTAETPILVGISSIIFSPYNINAVYGVTPVTRGGTGQTSYVAGELLIGDSTGTLVKKPLVAGPGITIINEPDGDIVISTTPASYVASISGTANRITASPSTGDVVVDIAAGYEGQSSITTLGTINVGTWHGASIATLFGGTGQSSYTNGQLLIGNSVGNTLSKATLTAGSGISILNGPGTITIATTGGGGSVTSVNISGSNGIGVAGTPITTSGTITLSLGDITPTSVIAAGIVAGSNLSGTNTGDQVISGTADRIDALATGTNYTIDIAATYSGQTSIVTTGTITTGAWQADPIETDFGGTGQSSYVDGELLIGTSVGTTLVKNTLTAGAGITITNGSGTITIASTVSGGTVTSVDIAGTNGIGVSGSPITSSGTITLSLGTITGSTWNGNVISTAYTEAQIITITGAADKISIGGTAVNPIIDIDANYVGQSSIDTVGIVVNGEWRALPVSTTYTDAQVIDITGTTNRIVIGGTGTHPTINISPSYIGQTSIITLGVVSAGTWQATTISTAYTEAKLKSLTGTSNRITIGGTTLDPIVDIAVTYAGQTSIDTLGTITSGTWAATTIAVNKGGTGQTSYTDGQLLIGNTTGNTLTKATLTAGVGVTIVNGSGTVTISAPGAGGTVTSVAVSGANGIGVSGSPITSSGTISLSLGTITGATWNGNVISTTYTEAQVIDITGVSDRITIGGSATHPTVDIAATYAGQTSITTLGTISAGTWQASAISTTYTEAKLKTLTGTSSRITIGGTSTDPTVDISSIYAGQTSIATLGTISTGTWSATTIAVNKGGTGQTSYTDGQLLIGNTSGNTLTKTTLTAGTGISISNSTGSITITATGTPVTSVTGTANQILVTGTTTPVLSISPTLILPGTLTLGGNIDGVYYNLSRIGNISIQALSGVNVEGTNYSTVTGSASGLGNQVSGWSFTVGAADIYVTQLGANNACWATGTISVGLYAIGGALLTSVVVSRTDTLLNKFRYKSIGSTPLTLTAGQTYVIVIAFDGFDPTQTSIQTVSSPTYGAALTFVSGRLALPQTGLPPTDPTSNQAIATNPNASITYQTGIENLKITASTGVINPGIWQGTKIGLAYGGTNADLSTTGGTAQYLKQSSSGAAITVGTVAASDIASGAALTRANDTNVTLTLGGTPTTALLVAASLTLGWTGTLGVTRGGTGTGTAFTAGSIVFAGTSGVYTQDNSNLFWDDTNNLLGIGTTSPQAIVDIGKATSSGTSTAMQRWTWTTDSTHWGLTLSQRHTGSAIVYDFLIQNNSTSPVTALTIAATGAVSVGGPFSISASANATWGFADQSTNAALEVFGTASVFMDWNVGSGAGDFDFRLQRNAGANGNLTIENKGTGSLLVSTNGTTGFAIDSSQNGYVAGNFSVTGVGKTLKIARGTNAASGTGATLVAGVVTVSTTAVATGDSVYITCTTQGGVVGAGIPAITIVNGTSFTITSASITDTSTFNWVIIKAA